MKTTLFQEVCALLLSYIIAFSIVMLLLVYTLNVPGLLTGRQDLVDEYYQTRFSTTIPFDLLLVFAYLALAQLVVYKFDLNSLVARLGVVVLTTIVISGYFYNMYLSYPENKHSFFSRWFYGVGLWAVLYDTIFLATTYAVMVYIRTYNMYISNRCVGQ